MSHTRPHILEQGRRLGARALLIAAASGSIVGVAEASGHSDPGVSYPTAASSLAAAPRLAHDGGGGDGNGNGNGNGNGEGQDNGNGNGRWSQSDTQSAATPSPDSGQAPAVGGPDNGNGNGDGNGRWNRADQGSGNASGHGEAGPPSQPKQLTRALAAVAEPASTVVPTTVATVVPTIVVPAAPVPAALPAPVAPAAHAAPQAATRAASHSASAPPVAAALAQPRTRHAASPRAHGIALPAPHVPGLEPGRRGPTPAAATAIGPQHGSTRVPALAASTLAGPARAAGPARTSRPGAPRAQAPGPHSDAVQTVIQRVEHVLPRAPLWLKLALGLSLFAAAVAGGFAVRNGRRARRQADEIAAASAAAAHDALTGLANRRGFEDALARELARAARHGREFVIAYADVRGLKPVNDSLGHLAGDNLLRTVAQLLSDSARAGDTVARIGGDEFAILLAEHSAEDAEPVTERIAAAVAVARERLGLPHPWDLTVGLAAYPVDGADAETLLGTADRRLYEQRGIALAGAR